MGSLGREIIHRMFRKLKKLQASRLLLFLPFGNMAVPPTPQHFCPENIVKQMNEETRIKPFT
jgi:hypothetical protein